ncbi:ABC-type Fe3+-siderophore transport system, permease component [Hahella chejuensis KCTC 2396]|uniref:ABC-type Fe3+-siderophore transport system, permease component n=1 Tax=Hahella chejuensis (strain KCTC 2396) TaxID=349521 RepID=Q2SGM1_HAHCH|nr:iron ABC transporter permease [Hahella chejuensis]ABC30203.1 ABC-type Fe3+-siderophore transport system, permease component [Hahella chejuensis KCTC 2396]
MSFRHLRARRGAGRVLQLLLALLVLAAAFSASIALGQISMPLSVVMDAFIAFDPGSTEHIIVTTTRLSRALTALCVGSALAVAGALMQALTRNPLASPGIFGVNAGALFAIALSTTLFSVPSLQHYIWIAFAGAAVAGTLVYCLSALGRDGLTPVRTVLAGAAITALFVSFTQGLLVINQEGLDSILFWLAGSVAGRSLDLVAPVAPFILFAIVASMALGRHINVLMSGDEVAKGLGQRTVILRLLMGALIIGLAGAAVAIAGNIVFVGLIVPHMVRAWLGADYRWVLPGCAVLGAVLLLSADVAARFLIPPQEVPIGVMTALLGTPFFIYLARRGMQHA